MKKTVKILAGLVLASALVSVSLVSCKKNKSNEVGVLSFLNLTEDDFNRVVSTGAADMRNLLVEQGYLKDELDESPEGEFSIRYFDTLDAMIMSLKSFELCAIDGIPQTTALYLCSRDTQLKTLVQYDMSKKRKEFSFADAAFDKLGEGFSFMLLEKNVALRNQIDAVLDEMKKDGSKDELVRTHILGCVNGAEPKPVLPEYEEGRETIKVAVTGALPPMDYVAPDGSFAGFNTALLAEIGKRLDKNIALVQVSSIGRATALASGTVDVVFWTRSSALKDELASLSSEEFDSFREKARSSMSEAEISSLDTYDSVIREDVKLDLRSFDKKRDVPDGTITTKPYFTDMPVLLSLKK